MKPLERVAIAVRMAGFGKFASEYVRACGDEAPEAWDLKGTFRHFGEKAAALDLNEHAVQAGVSAAERLDEVKLASAPGNFTAEFHAVNRLSSGLDKHASAEAQDELAARRLALWGEMKTAAERTGNVLSSLTKMALRVWSETARSGEKTASTRDEREGFALSFAANYIVDEKIASMYEAKEITLKDAVKLAHLSAECAMEDLSSVTGMCRCPDGAVKTAGFLDRFRSKPKAPPADRSEYDFMHDVMNKYAPGTSLYSAGEDEDDSGDLAYLTHTAHPGKKSYLSMGGLFDDVAVRGPDVYREIHDHFTNGGQLPNAVAPEDMKLYKRQPAQKSAAISQRRNSREKVAIDPRLVGAGIGAGVGAVAGAVSDKDNRWRGAGMGALLGAPTGALGGQVAKEVMGRNMPDPEKLRKGTDAFHRLMAAAQHMGNGVPEMFQEHQKDIINHFGEGRKDLPGVLINKMGHGGVQQLVELKKHLGAAVI